MATKKIQIEFDLNTNEVKLAGEATLSLAQQVKILQRELQKTPEGTKEFELLRRKLNDTRDNFDRVNAKSRELFGTLSLIPGPIGEIAGKVNGAISLFKTFSGFSFKDLRNQFAGLVDDIKGVFENLGRWGETTQDVSDNVQGLNNTTENFNNTLSNTVSNVGAAGDSVIEYNDKIQAEIDLLKDAALETTKNIQVNQEKISTLTETVSTMDDLNQMTDEQIGSVIDLIDENELLTENLGEQIGSIKELEAQQQGAIATTNAQVVANRTLTTSSVAASTALRVLKGVLASLGIGLLIIGITTLISKVYDWVTSTEAADRANEQLGDTISRLNRLIEDNLALVDEENKANILRAKAAGKSEKDIQEIQRQGFRDRIAIIKKGQEDLFNIESGAEFLKLTKEQQKQRSEEILKERNKLQSDLQNVESQARLFELQILADAAEDRRKKSKEISDNRNKDADDTLNKLKAQLDAQIQLEIDSENTRQDKLEQLLEERFLLEQKFKKNTKILEGVSAAELELLAKENLKKITNAINEDAEKRRQDKLKNIQAEIDIEQSQSQVNTEKLIELLSQRRDLEIQDAELTAKQKLAIQEKYEADFRQLRQQAREKQLVEDIQAAEGNFEKQIQLYRQFGQEVVNSTNYTEGEKLRIIQETDDKIQQLESERFNARVTKLQLEFGETFQFDQEYYNKLFDLYDEEEERYKELRNSEKITEEEFNQKMLELRDARIQLRQEEVNAQSKQLEAIAATFAAGAALVGESTRLGKGLAIAGATIDTYRAANQVLADPKVPTVLKAFSAAAIILRGLANVRRIVQTPIPGQGAQGSGGVVNQGVINVTARRAQGGLITGPGGETSDNVPALLSDGEFVINSRSTRVFRPLLETINSAANLPAFAVGGLVGGGQPTPFKSQNETIADAISTAFGQTPIRTYVTATDVTTQQQFDRVIKSRSLI